MKKTVMIAGAGDPVGTRLVRDFLKKDYTVAAALLDGQNAELPGEVLAISLNPLCRQSAMDAARKVEDALGNVDLLVVNMDCCVERDEKTILDEPDYEEMLAAYEYNSLGPLRTIDAFLPLLKMGEGRRICVITSKDSSNNMTRDTANFPSHISKAPLNMAMNQLFNALRPEGFTFRMYCKHTSAEPDKAGEFAVEYFTRNRSNEPESYRHSDENRLVLRDWMSLEIPW